MFEDSKKVIIYNKFKVNNNDINRPRQQKINYINNLIEDIRKNRNSHNFLYVSYLIIFYSVDQICDVLIQ